MALAGFKITNHPQQVAKRGASDTVDERITPDWLFDGQDALHDFTVDVAANAKNAKCDAFYDLANNGLTHSWAGERVWCNPPYSDIRPWVEKALAETAAGCPVVVMLLPANRTEQRWWQHLVEPIRDRGDGRLSVVFIARRFSFGVPGNEAAKFNSSPPFGCCLLTFGAVS